LVSDIYVFLFIDFYLKKNDFFESLENLHFNNYD